MSTPHHPPSHKPTLQNDTAQPHLASTHLTTSTLPSLLQETNNPPTTLSSSKPTTNLLTTSLKPTTITALSSTPHTPLTSSLAQSLLLDTLTQHPDSSAAVIDTTGNFDVVGLYARILRRGRAAADVSAKDHRSDSENQAEETKALKTLDRVRIMRVFNLEGVREAVAEVWSAMSVAEVREGPESPLLRRRTEVADSEDEEEEEEMLFDVPGSTEREALSASQHLRSRTASSGQRTGNQQAPSPLKLKFLLIDNLAHVLVPLLKKDSVKATNAATTLLATLNDLTRTHNLHTLLLNPFTTPPTTWPIHTIPPPTTTSNTPAPQQQNHGYNPPPPPQGPSIFSSQRNVPALLGLLSRYVDTHLLLSSLPRGKLDARVYYGEAGGRERAKRRGVEMGWVVEVIGERWGGNVGAWETISDAEGL